MRSSSATGRETKGNEKIGDEEKKKKIKEKEKKEENKEKNFGDEYGRVYKSIDMHTC